MLLTGANGFIGGHLKKHIKCITVDYTGCDFNGDLSDINFVNSLPEVDTIIHLAAFNSTKNFYSTPFKVINSIISPTMNLLQRYNNAHFVFASSSETYAGGIDNNFVTIPTPEEVVLSINDITNPRWSYASGKIAMESAIISSGIEHNRPWTILRLHNVYGANQKNHFIPEFVERLKKGKAELYGWKNTRAFCFIDDAIELIKTAINYKNEIINIGSNNEVRIIDIAHIIMDILNYDKSTLKCYDGPKGSTARRVPDITKILSYTKNFKFTSLQNGLEKIIK